MRDQLYPSVPHEAVLAKTVNQLDRSAQYRLSKKKEIDHLNDLGKLVRTMQRANDSKDEEIGRLKKKIRWYQFRQIGLTSIITALSLKGFEMFVVWLHTWFR